MYTPNCHLYKQILYSNMFCDWYNHCAIQIQKRNIFNHVFIINRLHAFHHVAFAFVRHPISDMLIKIIYHTSLAFAAAQIKFRVQSWHISRALEYLKMHSIIKLLPGSAKILREVSMQKNAMCERDIFFELHFRSSFLDMVHRMWIICRIWKGIYFVHYFDTFTCSCQIQHTTRCSGINRQHRIC